jgi:hypothetical protein
MWAISAPRFLIGHMPVTQAEHLFFALKIQIVNALPMNIFKQQ